MMLPHIRILLLAFSSPELSDFLSHTTRFSFLFLSNTLLHHVPAPEACPYRFDSVNKEPHSAVYQTLRLPFRHRPVHLQYLQKYHYNPQVSFLLHPFLPYYAFLNSHLHYL